MNFTRDAPANVDHPPTHPPLRALLRCVASLNGMAAWSMSVPAPSGRSVMTAGSFGRLAYGLAAMFAPRFMAGRYAPAEPESVMSLRGFGGQYIAIAVFTLFSARSRHLARPALLLNVGVDVCDAMAGGFEVREKGVGDPIAVGGVTLPAINLATWLWALRKLER